MPRAAKKPQVREIPHPHPNPPLEGEGAGRERLIMAVLRSSLEGVRTGLTKRQIGNTSRPLEGEGAGRERLIMAVLRSSLEGVIAPARRSIKRHT